MSSAIKTRLLPTKAFPIFPVFLFAIFSLFQSIGFPFDFELFTKSVPICVFKDPIIIYFQILQKRLKSPQNVLIFDFLIFVQKRTPCSTTLPTSLLCNWRRILCMRHESKVGCGVCIVRSYRRCRRHPISICRS